MFGGAVGCRTLNGSVTHVCLAALPGEFHLFLPFLKASFLCGGQLVMAMRATDTLQELVAGLVGCGDGQAAGRIAEEIEDAF